MAFHSDGRPYDPVRSCVADVHLQSASPAKNPPNQTSITSYEDRSSLRPVPNLHYNELLTPQPVRHLEMTESSPGHPERIRPSFSHHSVNLGAFTSDQDTRIAPQTQSANCADASALPLISQIFGPSAPPHELSTGTGPDIYNVRESVTFGWGPAFGDRRLHPRPANRRVGQAFIPLTDPDEAFRSADDSRRWQGSVNAIPMGDPGTDHLMQPGPCDQMYRHGSESSSLHYVCTDSPFVFGRAGGLVSKYDSEPGSLEEAIAFERTGIRDLHIKLIKSAVNQVLVTNGFTWKQWQGSSKGYSRALKGMAGNLCAALGKKGMLESTDLVYTVTKEKIPATSSRRRGRRTLSHHSFSGHEERLSRPQDPHDDGSLAVLRATLILRDGSVQRVRETSSLWTRLFPANIRVVSPEDIPAISHQRKVRCQENVGEKDAGGDAHTDAEMSDVTAGFSY